MISGCKDRPCREGEQGEGVPRAIVRIIDAPIARMGRINATLFDVSFSIDLTMVGYTSVYLCVLWHCVIRRYYHNSTSNTKGMRRCTPSVRYSTCTSPDTSTTVERA